MKIPKLIHQTVRDKYHLSNIYIENIKTLQELNPDWTHRLYDDDDVLDFIRNNYDDETLKRYEAINPIYGAARADYFRYLLILKLGGVYLDIKSTCNKKLDEVLRDDDVFILSYWNNKRGELYEGYGIHPELPPPGEYQQWHIIAAPDHRFLRAVVAAVSRQIAEYTPFTHGVGWHGVMRTTGPIVYTTTIHELEKNCSDYRVVQIEDLGFNYSILSTKTNPRMHQTPAHYRYQRSPTILRAFFDSAGRRIDLRTLSRNSRCPCGSGARLKHCHGIL